MEIGHIHQHNLNQVCRSLQANLNVLVLEDDPSVCFLLSEQLQILGHTVIEASDSDTAIALLDDGSLDFDLLITDVSVPGPLDGWAVARHARCHRPKLSVLYSTGLPAGSDKAVPDSLILNKPFKFGHLQSAILMLCNLHPREMSQTTGFRKGRC